MTSPARENPSAPDRSLTSGLPAARFLERGSATLWVLGLCLALLGLGGITIDLWRGFGNRRALTAAVDAAAIAGTSGLDEQAIRNREGIRLDPTRARQLALASLVRQTEVTIDSVDIAVNRDEITVSAHTRVELGLLRILMVGEPLDVQASSTAHPRRGK